MDQAIRNALQNYRRTLIGLSADYLQADKAFDHRSACESSMKELETRLRESGLQADHAKRMAKKLAAGERRFAFATVSAVLYDTELRDAPAAVERRVVGQSLAPLPGPNRTL